jgi:hypothetical protein
MTDIIDGENVNGNSVNGNSVNGNTSTDATKNSVELDRGGKNAPGAFMVKASHYFIGGFALATALTWNTSIREAIKQKFPIPEDNVRANFIFAVIITAMLIVLIYILPDTKSELPEDTQRKAKIEQERHDLRIKVATQQLQLAELQRDFANVRANGNMTTVERAHVYPMQQRFVNIRPR